MISLSSSIGDRRELQKPAETTAGERSTNSYTPPEPPSAHARRAALRVVVPYAAFAAAWIYFSDLLMHRWAPSLEALAWWSVLKGLFFVGSTAALLYFLVRYMFQAAQRAQAGASDAEERVRLLASTTSALVWRTDASGERAKTVEPWAAFTGIPADQLAQPGGWLAALHPDDRGAPMEPWRKALETGSDFGTEFRLRRRDGAWRYMMARGGPIRDAAGVTQEWVGFCLDVTDRRAAEEAVRMQARILDSVGEAVIATDASGAVIYMNRYAETLYGWIADEALGRSIMDVTVPVTSRAAAEEIMRQLRQGSTWSGEFLVSSRDGRQFPIAASNTPLQNDKGELVAIIGVSREITERKANEEALRQRKRQLQALAARLNAVREEEAVRIARELHDQLGQALTGLTMEVAQVQRRVRSSNGHAPEGVEAQLSSISKSLQETIETTRRICTELRPPLLDQLGLAPAIESLARDFEARTGIMCDLLLADCEPKVSEATAVATFRILQEVLTNVARHSGATEVQIELTCPHDELQLRVADNGRGITREELQRPCGLGLLGMRERAAAVGGNVEIAAQNGSGTTVAVAIPLREQIA
jgi:PAS domain S-box-containing protein